MQSFMQSLGIQDDGVTSPTASLIITPAAGRWGSILTHWRNRAVSVRCTRAYNKFISFGSKDTEAFPPRLVELEWKGV
jgi:hypothetical protein